MQNNTIKNNQSRRRLNMSFKEKRENRLRNKSQSNIREKLENMGGVEGSIDSCKK